MKRAEKRTNEARTIISGNTINISNSKILSPENCNITIEAPLKNLNKWELKRLYNSNAAVRRETKKEFDRQALKEFKNTLYDLVGDAVKHIQNDVIEKGMALSPKRVMENAKGSDTCFIAGLFVAYESFLKEKGKDFQTFFIENLADIFDMENTTVTSDYRVKEHYCNLVG